MDTSERSLSRHRRLVGQRVGEQPGQRRGKAAFAVVAGYALKNMNCEYVRKYYGVPACIGRRVMVYGKPGIISEDRGNYIGVTLDTDKPGRVSNYHPTDKVEYLGMGKVRKLTRSQQNYRDFQRSDCGHTFAEWMRFKSA